MTLKELIKKHGAPAFHRRLVESMGDGAPSLITIYRWSGTRPTAPPPRIDTLAEIERAMGVEPGSVYLDTTQAEVA